MPNGTGMKRDDFNNLIKGDMILGLGILYEAQIEMQEFLKETITKIDDRFEKGQERFKKMENRKLIDTTYAAIGGAISGALGALGIKWGGN